MEYTVLKHFVFKGEDVFYGDKITVESEFEQQSFTKRGLIVEFTEPVVAPVKKIVGKPAIKKSK